MRGASRIGLAVPGRSSRTGNWVTARRWERILTDLGHDVHVRGVGGGGGDNSVEAVDSLDVLIALHAQKTFTQIDAFQSRYPERPLVVTLTGTDLYRDVERSEDAQRALRWADRLVVLQPQAFDALGLELRTKARLIRQSTTAPAPQPKAETTFDVCVIGHLRTVKDPFRAAQASRLLPDDSKIRIVHAGSALTDEMERRARREERENPRYTWLGELERDETLRLLARSHALAHTSLLEGGANAMSEAFVAGLPVVSSRIGGSVGMLGEDHPAYFEPGDTEGLTRLLYRCETDPDFLAELERRSRALAPLYSREKEVTAWASLLGEL